ncbi:potassium channel subfamily K member 5-like isoform 2-T2 [Aulostomus maculatus]
MYYFLPVDWSSDISNPGGAELEVCERQISPGERQHFEEVVSEAAGQGLTVTGEKHRNTWDWGNSVIFAASIVTTIGYGNVAPKTQSGRVFCILYGLCGIPLCLVWISELGSFFGDRAKRLSQVLIRKDVSVKKVQFTCTALFLLWGLFVHLLIPPFVFMFMEEWSYLEGLYFSFITLTTVGFGDYVAGVNPNIEYPTLYRVFAEIWIYMGLAWLSLFFSWNVNMVVEAHKVLRKRRQKNKVEEEEQPAVKPTVIDIFSFLSEKEDDYSSIIKEIGLTAKRRKSAMDRINRSKSCSDILTTNIQQLDHSPRKAMTSIREVFMNANVPMQDIEKEAGESSAQENGRTSGAAEHERTEGEEKDSNNGIVFTVTARDTKEEEEPVEPAKGGGTRFKISKVEEEVFLIKKEEEG